MNITLPLVGDFELSGSGSHPVWQSLPWLAMTRVGKGTSTYQSRCKLAWSTSGIYCLADCEDRRLACQERADFDDLFNDDVIEAFFWPDEAHPLYLEYEISPLGKELPILVANRNGAFMGWLPWRYAGPRKTRTATHVRGGEARPGAAVEGWSVEFFIPFALFAGVARKPEQGERWRANVYRIDRDEEQASQWALCTDTGGRFHDFRNFGSIEFGPG